MTSWCDPLSPGEVITLRGQAADKETYAGKYKVIKKLAPTRRPDTKRYSYVYLVEQIEEPETKYVGENDLEQKNREPKNKLYVYKCFSGRNASNAYEIEKEVYNNLFSYDKPRDVYAIPKPLQFFDDLQGLLLEYFPTSLEDQFAPLRIHASGGNRVLLNNEILKLSYHMAAALKSLHNREIVHGDIHSGNIVFKDDQYWLIDFERAYISGQHNTDDEITYISDIQRLGEVLFYVYHNEKFEQEKYIKGRDKDAQTLKTHFINKGLPFWFASLLSEMLSGIIPDGNALRNRLPQLLEDEAEWLLSDKRWATLSEHYTQSIAMHRSPGRYRLGRGVLRGFDVSADGAVLAVITSTGLWLRDIKHTQLIEYDEASHLPLAVSWRKCLDCQRHLLAVIYADKTIHIWLYQEMQDEQKIRVKTVEKLFVLPPLPDNPISLAWGEGQQLAVGTEDGNIYVWKIEDGESYQYRQAYYIATQAGAIRAMTWLGMHQLVFGGESGILYLWNDIKHPFHKALKKINEEITGIISCGNSQIIFTSANGVIRQCDINLCDKGTIEFAIRHPGKIVQVLPIRQHKNGDIIFATVDQGGQINIWDTAEQHIVDGIAKSAPVTIYQYSSHRNMHVATIDEGDSEALLLLAGSARQGAIHQYQYHISPQSVRRIQKLRSLNIFDLRITTLAWLENGSDVPFYSLVAGNEVGIIEKFVIDSITVASAAASDQATSITEAFAVDVRVLRDNKISIPSHTIRKILPTPSKGKTEIAIACSDFTIRFWDYMQQKVTTAKIDGDATGAMAWHPSGNILAYATEGAGIAFYWPRAQIVVEQLLPTGGYVRNLVFNLDGTRLAAISNTTSLRLIELENVGEGYFCSQNDKEFQFYEAPLTAVTWLPYIDAWLLANESGHIWLVKTDGSFDGLLYRLRDAYVTHLLTWHSQGDDTKRWKLAIAYSDHRIELWPFNGKVDLGTEYRQRKKMRLLPSGHTDHITDISFSIDGQWLASSSMDGSLIIYPLGH